MDKKIYQNLLDFLEKSKKCNNLGEITALTKDIIMQLKENGFINEMDDEKEHEKSLFSYCVKKYGEEKSKFSMTDKFGVEFCIGNFVYDCKLFFVVSANGKVVECAEIKQNANKHQLEIIRDKIDNLMVAYKETVLLQPLMDLSNEIGLMQMDIFENN